MAKQGPVVREGFCPACGNAATYDKESRSFRSHTNSEGIDCEGFKPFILLASRQRRLRGLNLTVSRFDRIPMLDEFQKSHFSGIQFFCPQCSSMTDVTGDEKVTRIAPHDTPQGDVCQISSIIIAPITAGAIPKTKKRKRKTKNNTKSSGLKTGNSSLSPNCPINTSNSVYTISGGLPGSKRRKS